MMDAQPTLEQYGLSESAYRDYEQERARLTALKELYEVPGWIIFCAVAGLVYFLLLSFGSDPWNSISVSVVVALYAGFIFTAFQSEISDVIFHSKHEKNKRIETEIKQLDTFFTNRIRPFEKAAKEYYETRVQNFYEEKLYKKHSGNKEFENNLAEFATMLDELHKANDVFKTTRFYLSEYDSYLLKRQIDQWVPKELKEPGFETLNKITSKKPASVETLKANPPQQFYARARKIDWDKKNTANKLTGLKGEEIVLILEKEYLLSVDREDLAQRVSHVAKERGDGLGYDVLSFSPDGQEKYIEVKSTTGAVETPFYLSRNELGFLEQNRNSAFIYRIANVVEGEEPVLQVHSAEEILSVGDITPTQFLVRV